MLIHSLPLLGHVGRLILSHAQRNAIADADALEFYQRLASQGVPSKMFSFGTFLSTSSDVDITEGFSMCPAPKQAVIFTIQKNDATPCFLDRTMTANKVEKEHLFSPQARFQVTQAPEPCPGENPGFGAHPACIGLSYAGGSTEEGGGDLRRAVKSRTKLSERVEQLVRSAKKHGC